MKYACKAGDAVMLGENNRSHHLPPQHELNAVTNHTRLFSRTKQEAPLQQNNKRQI